MGPCADTSVQNRHYLWEDGGANIIGVDMAEPEVVNKNLITTTPPGTDDTDDPDDLTGAGEGC
jgi:hypothetical protein